MLLHLSAIHHRSLLQSSLLPALLLLSQQILILPELELHALSAELASCDAMELLPADIVRDAASIASMRPTKVKQKARLALLPVLARAITPPSQTIKARANMPKWLIQVRVNANEARSGGSLRILLMPTMAPSAPAMQVRPTLPNASGSRAIKSGDTHPLLLQTRVVDRVRQALPVRAAACLAPTSP